ncbi:MAG: TonB-dependent receptor [Phocaeicola sp.]|nr:TonB-dependent receptor [Phocaeicola sp.]
MKGNNHACKLWRYVFCCLVLLPLKMWTQEKRDTLTGKVHSIENVTIQGRRIPKNITTSSPTQLLKKAEMERLGALEVSDAVRHFSGVSIKDYGGIGGMKTVSIRSLGAQHTTVSYDGVAVSDCQSGQVDISRFSLDNVSQLTMNIGQSDNIYQTAKMFASAGSLSIETVRPDFDEQTYHLSTRVKAGSFGMLNPSILYSKKLSHQFSLSAYGDYLRADGNYPFEMWNGSQLINSKRNNSDIETYRTELNLFTTLNDKQDLKAKFYLFDSKRGLPGSVIYDNPYAAERLYDRNYFGQLKYENRFSDRWKLQASGKFNYSWIRDYNKQASGDKDDHFRQTESYLSATLWTEPVRGLSFSLAQDFAYNDLSTTLRECQYPERFTLLTALAAHYRNPHITATASLLNTYITENVKTGTAADDRKRLSPAISLSWKPFDNAGWRIRASYKDIFRVPTFNDLYYLLIGNNRLKPENTKQVNIGTTWSNAFPSIIDYLNISIDAYYNRVNNKIVAIPTMFVWKMSNVGKVETLGIDINAGCEVSLAEGYKLYVTGTYNFMQAEDITDRESKIWRNQIAYTPKHAGSGNVTIELPWLNLTYNITYASERYRMSQNSNDNRIAPYTDNSLSISRMFHWKKQSFRIQLDALNLGNKNYEIVRFYPMPGRNYKITLAYNL